MVLITRYVIVGHLRCRSFKKIYFCETAFRMQAYREHNFPKLYILQTTLNFNPSVRNLLQAKTFKSISPLQFVYCGAVLQSCRSSYILYENMQSLV